MLPHFAHFTRTLSIHGLCNSKFGPSGSFDAASTISFLENNSVCLPQSLQSHIGRGHPQSLSREIHHGCFSLIIPKNRFFGWSKNSLHFQLHLLPCLLVCQSCKTNPFLQARLFCAGI